MNADSKNAKPVPLQEYARSILKLEAEAILNLLPFIDDYFESAVETILAISPANRLIVSGMGKASFIAMKISATFASTGVPSFFLHPAEAAHGDLGRYSKGDVALLLSNSGETTEVLRIIPHIKRIGCPIIAITGNTSSTLAGYCDTILSIGRINEAGPHGLAPTTSTTAMLALADALAMAVFSRQQFSREKFAFYHPGGNIGASLLSVSQVMRKNDENCVVPQSLPTRETLHRITSTKGRPGAASIVDEKGLLVGVFTDGNLRRCLEQGSDFLNKPIAEVMTRNPKVISQERLASEALHLLSEHKIDQILVIDQEHHPVGMVDIQDLVDIGLK
jgi:arabinose-5-phosphate isomerase